MMNLLFATTLKVLMIGNSFSLQMQKEMPPIAADLGLELDICSMYIGGCSLERHWQNVQAATNAAFRPYYIDRNRLGERLKRFAANIPEMLLAEKWDVVTIQQASHFSWQPATYQPWGDRLVAYIREKAPQAKIVVQETWSYTPWDGRLAKWGIDQNVMYAALHAAYGDFAAKHKLEVIPTGTAVQLWRRSLPVRYVADSLGGDVVGSAMFARNEKTGAWAPKGDVFHMGPTGNYLQALVWAAKLFNVDVSACKYAPKGVGFEPERVELMKRVAMRAVK